MGRHSAPSTYPYSSYDPTDPSDRLTVAEVSEVLVSTIDPDELGESSSSDWMLSALFLLAGWPGQDAEASEWIAPRISLAAQHALRSMGFGPQGMET